MHFIYVTVCPVTMVRGLVQLCCEDCELTMEYFIVRKFVISLYN